MVTLGVLCAVLVTCDSSVQPTPPVVGITTDSLLCSISGTVVSDWTLDPIRGVSLNEGKII